MKPKADLLDWMLVVLCISTCVLLIITAWASSIAAERSSKAAASMEDLRREYYEDRQGVLAVAQEVQNLREEIRQLRDAARAMAQIIADATAGRPQTETARDYKRPEGLVDEFTRYERTRRKHD